MSALLRRKRLAVSRTPLLLVLVVCSALPYLCRAYTRTIVKNRATGTCLSASKLSVPGSPVFFNEKCEHSSSWFRPEGSPFLMHAPTRMCLAYSPMATNAAGNLPLVVSPDCEGVAIPFIVNAEGLLQNNLNPQWCLQAIGGVADDGVPAVMAPNCLPLVTLQFDVETLDFPDPSPSPPPTPPSPSPPPPCTVCVTMTNFFTPLTTSVPPTITDCQNMAVELNANVLLNQLVPSAPLNFACTAPPARTGNDLDVYFQVCAEHPAGVNNTWVADVDLEAPVYHAALSTALAFDCDIQLTMNSTCSSDTSTYNSACKKKKPPPAARRFA